MGTSVSGELECEAGQAVTDARLPGRSMDVVAGGSARYVDTYYHRIACTYRDAACDHEQFEQPSKASGATTFSHDAAALNP